MPAVRATAAEVDEFRRLYDGTKADVYGYLRHRCGDPALAEDLTSEVYLAAVRECRAGRGDVVSVRWLVGVARNKLVDHWRRREREARRLRKLAGGAQDQDLPPGSEETDVERVRQALADLSPDHRAALTLKYVDGCSLEQAADALGRSVKATGSLLERARQSMRDRLAEVRDE